MLNKRRKDFYWEEGGKNLFFYIYIYFCFENSTASRLQLPATWTWPNTPWTNRCAPCSWRAVSTFFPPTLRQVCVRILSVTSAALHLHHQCRDFKLFVAVQIWCYNHVLIARVLHCQGATTYRTWCSTGQEGTILWRVWTPCGWLSTAWRATTPRWRRLCTKQVQSGVMCSQDVVQCECNPSLLCV